MYNKYETPIILEIIDKLNNSQKQDSLAKEYNISRSTIRYWYKNKEHYYIEKNNSISFLDSKAYSYILGLYLGDGYIDKMKRTYRLRIALDSKQDLVISECIKNLNILFPNNKINPIKIKNANCVLVTIYSNLLLSYFPHLGKGMKHERKIELTTEQKEVIINDYLMRGLFHSDGSFFIALNKYPRYQFTNKSEDIIELFKECIIKYDIIPKIRKRKNGIYDIQIQNRKDVNKLYPLLGEKYVNNKRYNGINLVV